MILNLNKAEVDALDRELLGAGPELDALREKLARLKDPTVPDVIPGQIDIYDALENAA